MLGHGGSSAGSYLANPTSPIPSHCAVIILFQSVTVHQLSRLALRVNYYAYPFGHTCTYILYLHNTIMIRHKHRRYKLYHNLTRHYYKVL